MQGLLRHAKPNETRVLFIWKLCRSKYSVGYAHKTPEGDLEVRTRHHEDLQVPHVRMEEGFVTSYPAQQLSASTCSCVRREDP